MARRRIGLEEGTAEAAAAVLAAGGVAVFPTETVYGVGAAAGHAGGMARLRTLKGREGGKPFQLLAADIGMAAEAGAVFRGGALALARRFWPGPLTLVVPARDGTALGIRIPDFPFVRDLCLRLGGMVAASSANRAGEPAPADAEAADAFGDAVDLLVDAGPASGGVASTVVECLRDDYRILREGAIAAPALAAAWNF